MSEVKVVNSQIGKGIATVALAVACIAWMHYTGGVSGIGWFAFITVLMWC